MSGNYIFYFDSGTSNTRAYLLGSDFEILCVRKRNVGSKDSAIAGSNLVLIEALWELYEEILGAFSISDSDVSAIYASGMLSSPYGLCEIAHINVPVSVRGFSESIHAFREDTRFHRSINIIPGLKSLREDFSYSGNMRGEEIEIFGALDELKKNGLDNVALILPGSHTHVALIKNGAVEDILSSFTGELFHALKEETIFSPILDVEPPELDGQMVKLAYENLKKLGFNRALYIGHAMRIFDRYTPEQRYSYCEAVVNGGVRQALEHYCAGLWRDCETVAIVSDEFMYRLFALLFEDSPLIKKVLWLPIESDSVYSVKGLKKILSTDRG